MLLNHLFDAIDQRINLLVQTGYRPGGREVIGSSVAPPSPARLEGRTKQQPLQTGRFLLVYHLFRNQPVETVMDFRLNQMVSAEHFQEDAAQPSERAAPKANEAGEHQRRHQRAVVSSDLGNNLGEDTAGDVFARLVIDHPDLLTRLDEVCNPLKRNILLPIRMVELPVGILLDKVHRGSGFAAAQFLNTVSEVSNLVAQFVNVPSGRDIQVPERLVQAAP